MIRYGHHVFYVRERNGQYYLVEDSRPELEIRLPDCRNAAEAELLAWNLIRD